MYHLERSHGRIKTLSPNCNCIISLFLGFLLSIFPRSTPLPQSETQPTTPKLTFNDMAVDQSVAAILSAINTDGVRVVPSTANPGMFPTHLL